jgi:hypothetical protein
MRSRLVAVLLGACALAGCGSGGTTGASQANQGEVASRFARAVLHGDVSAARSLLVRDEAALLTLVRRAAAPWQAHHAAVEPLPRRTGNRWTFRYATRRTFEDGRFETESGSLVVFVTPTAHGAGVTYFVFTGVRKRFGTHHDSVLLPSNR